MQEMKWTVPALVLRQGPVLIYDWKDYVIYAGRGGYGVSFTMDVAVRNESYDKEVGVVWRVVEVSRTGGATLPQEWNRTTLSYAGVIEHTMERWSAEARQMGSVVEYVEYAVFASMNGATYWDNASGVNYRIYSSWTPSPSRGVVAAGSVRPLGPSPSRAFEFSGRAQVWDYPGDKEVSVLFSTDGWSTVHTILAKVVDEAWIWNATFTNPRSERLEFAVRYRVEGVDFWDNNKGQNYAYRLERNP